MSIFTPQGPTIPGSGNFHDLQVDRLNAIIGGGIPAGSNRQIQYNDDNKFGASSSFLFNKEIVNPVLIINGSNTSSIHCGNLNIISTSGNVSALIGASSSAGNGEEIQITSGNSTTANAGNILLTTGNSGIASAGNIVLTAGTGAVLGTTPTPDGSVQFITNLTPLVNTPMPVTITQGGISLMKFGGPPVTTTSPSTTVDSRQGVINFDDSDNPIPPLTGLIITVSNNTLQPGLMVPFISNDNVMCCISNWVTGGGTLPNFTYPQPTVTVGNINQPSLYFELNIFNTDPVNSLSNVNILFMLI